MPIPLAAMAAMGGVMGGLGGKQKAKMSGQPITTKYNNVSQLNPVSQLGGYDRLNEAMNRMRDLQGYHPGMNNPYLGDVMSHIMGRAGVTSPSQYMPGGGGGGFRIPGGGLSDALPGGGGGFMPPPGEGFGGGGGMGGGQMGPIIGTRIPGFDPGSFSSPGGGPSGGFGPISWGSQQLQPAPGGGGGGMMNNPYLGHRAMRQMRMAMRNQGQAGGGSAQGYSY